VLTVNLHTYQETDPLQRLRWVAEVIARGGVDLVAFQECAQRRTSAVVETVDGVQLRADNAARVVVAELAGRWGQPYISAWDWSHYGFAVWEEGVAVLGRSAFTLAGHEARFISTATDPGTIDARKALLGAWDVPGLGRVDLLSTHVSWGGPQPDQLAALLRFAGERADAGAALTLVAGDFNLDYDTDGYRQVVDGGAWVDAFLEAAPGGARDPTLGEERIDYQLRARGGRLVPFLAQRVFLQLAAPEAANQRVSDHLGVMVHYRLRP
jgi:maltose 6'-phosphate phosphatase